TLDRAQIARVRASQACYRNERALAGHQLGREPAELLAIDGHDGGAMMFGMTVLDLAETMVERLVANRGAGLARLEAFAVVFVVMMRVLGDRLLGEHSRARQAKAGNSKNLAASHVWSPDG